jgi:hypothetical protein
MNPFIGPNEREVYVRALEALADERVPVLVGGAYAMFHYTGMCRQTKDLDLFLRREDEPRAREVLQEAGFRTEVREPIWLSKAFWGDLFVDLIHSSGNGVALVDEAWIEHAPWASVLGVPVRLVPPEEMIWSKAYVQERERFDGADVLHLVRSCGRTMDWRRLVARFDSHWQVLLAHLSLYSFSYPHDRDRVPRWVWRTLLDRARHEKEEEQQDEKLCRGTLLSRVQFLPDVGLWGYRDARELEVPGFEPPPDAEVHAPRFAAHPSAADADGTAVAAFAPDV